AHDRVVGTTITTINTLEFWKSIQQKVSPPEDNMVYLIDGRGVLLAHQQDSNLHQGDLLTHEAIVRTLLTHTDWDSTEGYQGFEQQPVFGIGSHINNLSWSVISEIPASRIMLPIEKALTYLVFIVFLVHIIFGFFAALMVRRMLRPIHDLTQAMQSAEEGNYKTTLPNSPYTEINNLIQHFQSMAQTIAQRESELEQFMRALEHLGESIFITDKEGVICYINPAFEKTTGHDHSILGLSMLQFPQGSESNTACRHLEHCIQTGTSWEGKTTAYKANGDSFSALIHISPVSSNKKLTHFVTILQDMSEHNLLEEQLFQAQKIESIGTLVGGIAHDFNNNLAAIMGNTYLAKASIKAGRTQDSMQKVENIESLSKHAAKIVSQLMAYARQDIVQKEHIVFNSIIEDTLTLSQVTIPENIQFTVNIEKNDYLVLADKAQMQQILMNLLNNARDAVAETEQPRIILRVKPVLADANFHKRNPNISTLHFMRLSVQDNGYGISTKDLPHIFDPFFTTKEVGKGTGLGLSMVFGMIQSHHGVIEVESKQEQGSTFHMYLPIVEEQPKSTQDVITAGCQAHGEKILLIDDDTNVRKTTTEVLTSFGYDVIQASDGTQGLQRLERHEDIALVITDVVMPQMGGVAFAKKFYEQNYAIGIIFLTGYSDTPAFHELGLNHIRTLHKPVHFDELHHAIQQTISAS
ncbi:response regulator, partial [bacterium AH-315-I20]|nr:response regulator [bacterium AH-315-I20]